MLPAYEIAASSKFDVGASHPGWGGRRSRHPSGEYEKEDHSRMRSNR